MGENILDPEPILVGHQKSFNQVFALITNTLHLRDLERVKSFLNRSNNFLIVVAVEGWDCGHQDVEDDTGGPKVAFLVVAACDYLWGYVVRLC